jgi:4-hydroxy-3-polyprenylbenzoate decarboxylase
MGMNKIVIATTGASGSIYAKVLLDKLLLVKAQWEEVSIVMTANAETVWQTELDQDNSYYKGDDCPFTFYQPNDFNAPLHPVRANTIL